MPRRACGWRRPPSRLRHDLDAEPDAAIAAECPAAARGCHRGRPGAGARAGAADHGPDQPAGAAGVRRSCQERHSFLDGQLEDIRQTRRELSKVIRAVDEEIVKVFSAAFADVSQNFTAAVRDAVPGW